MEIVRLRALRGPNLWSRKTAMHATVQCLPEETQVQRLPGFLTSLRSLFPAIGVLSTEDGQPASLAHVLQFAALTLQTEAGSAVNFARTLATREAGLYQVIVEYTEEAVGREAMQAAEQLILAALYPADAPAFDSAAMIARLRARDERERLGPSTGSIVQAAVARGIPYRRLTRGSLVQFGWGSRQRRIQAAEIDATSTVAESIAQDKELSKKLLLAAGVPVPLGRPVHSVDDAWQAALEIGLPVVTKPQDGNQGKGVTVNIQSREALEHAYRSAADPPEVVFDFRTSRSGAHVRQFLGHWRGSLMVDDYGGYKAGFAGGITELGCWAHARRKWHDQYADSGSAIAAEALARMAVLYRIEQACRDMGADARHAYRQEHAVPVLDALKQWLDQLHPTVAGSSGTGKALAYTLRRWDALVRYADDGRYPIDNNPIENAIRSIALGRKNWLFAGSEQAGKRAAAIMSLLATAKANGIDPHAWLTDTLARLPTTLDRDIDTLLPLRQD